MDRKYTPTSTCAACDDHANHPSVFNRAEEAKADGSFVDISYIERTCIRCGYKWHETPLYLFAPEVKA